MKKEWDDLKNHEKHLREEVHKLKAEKQQIDKEKSTLRRAEKKMATEIDKLKNEQLHID